MFGQELRAGEVHEIEKIPGKVRRIGLLSPEVEHAQWRRGVTVESRIGIGVAQVDVGLVVLPAHFAEALPDSGGRDVAPAGLVEIIAGDEIIEGTHFPPGLSLERAPPEGAAIALQLGARVVMSA